MRSREKEKSHIKRKSQSKTKKTQAQSLSPLVHDLPLELKKLVTNFSGLVSVLEAELESGSKMNAARCNKGWEENQERLMTVLEALDPEIDPGQQASLQVDLYQLSYVLSALNQLEPSCEISHEALDAEQLLSTVNALYKMKAKSAFPCAKMVNAIVKKAWAKADELQSQIDQVSHNKSDALKGKLVWLEQCLVGLIALEETVARAERLQKCVIAQSDLLRAKLLTSDPVKFKPVFGKPKLEVLQAEWQKTKKMYKTRASKEREACNILNPNIEILKKIAKKENASFVSALLLELMEKRRSLRLSITSYEANSEMADRMFIFLGGAPHLYAALSKRMEKRPEFYSASKDTPPEKIKAMKLAIEKIKTYLNNSQAAYHALLELNVSIKALIEEWASNLSFKTGSIFKDFYDFLTEEQKKIEMLLKDYQRSQCVYSEKLDEYASAIRKENKFLKGKEAVSQFSAVLADINTPQDLMMHFSKVQRWLPPEAASLFLYKQAIRKFYNLSLNLGHYHADQAKQLAHGFSQCFAQYIQTEKPSASDRGIVFSIFRVLDKLRCPVTMTESDADIFMRSIPNKELTLDNLLLLSRFGFSITDKLRQLASSPIKLSQICLQRDDVNKVESLLRVAVLTSNELASIEEHLASIKNDIAKHERDKNIFDLRGNIQEAETVDGVVAVIGKGHKELALNDFKAFIALVAAFQKIKGLHLSNLKAGRNTAGDISFLFLKLKEFWSAPSPDFQENPSIVHSQVMHLLRAVNEMDIDLPAGTKAELKKMLNFSHIYGSSPHVPNDILVCAQAGFDISSVLEGFIHSSHCEKLGERDITNLLMACCLHDVTFPDNSIASEITDKLFGLANEFYLPLLSSKGEGDLWKNKLFGEDKFEGGACRDSEAHRRLVQAATFYRFPLENKLLDYLNASLAINGNEKASKQQIKLLKILTTAFESSPYIKVFCEKRVDCGFSLDIVICNEKTGERFNVEYDGMVGHYYRDCQFRSTYRQVRKDLVQDAALRKNDYEVYRFNHTHFQGPSTEIKKLIVRIEPALKELLNTPVKDKQGVGSAQTQISPVCLARMHSTLFFQASNSQSNVNSQPVAAVLPPPVTTTRSTKTISKMNPDAASYYVKDCARVGVTSPPVFHDNNFMPPQFHGQYFIYPQSQSSCSPPREFSPYNTYEGEEPEAPMAFGYSPAVYATPQAAYPYNMHGGERPGVSVVPGYLPTVYTYEGEEPEVPEQQGPSHLDGIEQPGPQRFSRGGQ